MKCKREDGTELFYEWAGEPARADRAPVVLLNGIMMTTRSWAAHTERLTAAGHACLLHDFRGQLESGKPDGAYSMAQHVEDLAALLDQTGVEAAHLVGTSYGGEVGLFFALKHPERVRSLSLIACAAHAGPRLRQQMRVWAATARERPDRLYDVTAPDNFSAAFLERHPDLIAEGRARLADYPEAFFPAFARLVEAFAAFDVRERLEEVRVPTLVACGAGDTLKPPAYSRALAEGIPDAEYLLVPGAGHAVVLEAAGAVQTAVQGMLAKHG